ncbi:MAG: hypothetical protein HON70_40000 [Lentisphaerae bacterium]|nr:hypothetical protein [Lentisphaerota bacterium]
MASPSVDIIRALVEGRIPERMGFRDPVWPQTLKCWVKQGYPVDENGAPVDPAVHFDHDWGTIGASIDTMPLRGYREGIEETEEWIVARNGAGAAHRRWKHRAGVPEHIDFAMTDRAVWERDYRPYLLELDRSRINVDRARKAIAERREQGKWVMCNSGFVFENMRQSMGDLTMYESFVADPEWIRDYCTVMADFQIMHLQALFDEAGWPDGIRLCEDLGYKSGLFCSPASLADLLFPHYKRVVDFLHARGVAVFLHSCGGVTEALDLVREAGFDSIDPLERAAGCDPRAFAEKTEGKLIITGGFDKRILESGDRQAIRREIVGILDYMRKNGVRYIFSTDHSVSTNVSYADYQYYAGVFRENMAY